MPVSPEELINQALVAIGHARINSINEGSRAAIAALEIYGQTRDELLDAGTWPFARRSNIPLQLLKGPPPAGGYNPNEPWTAAYPPPGWLYAYSYPADMLDLRAVMPRPSAMFDLDPQPAVWRVDNDDSLVDNAGAPTAQKKIILTNIKDALAVYIAQVTDPALWEPGFIEALVKALQPKLALALKEDLALERQDTAEEAAAVSRADQRRG